MSTQIGESTIDELIYVSYFQMQQLIVIGVNTQCEIQPRIALVDDFEVVQL